MKRIVIGAILAAFVLFLWGFVFWALGFVPDQLIRTAPDQEALGEALDAVLDGTGAYFLPYPNGEITMEESMEMQGRGPVATIHYRAEGVAAPQGLILLGGFLHMLATVLLLALALHWVAGHLGSYWARVKFVFVFGLAAAVWANLGDPIWWHHTWSWHLMVAAYDAAAWLLAGLVLARFVDGE